MESKNELKYIFANINEWLKFAEAKHGGLIVLNVALVVGILSSYPSISHCIFKPSILLGMVCFGISIFLSLLSQFPVTQNIFHNIKVINNPNLYFFGHICHFDKDAFVNHLKTADSSFVSNKLDEDLINQILVNARITQAKYSFFKFASYSTAFGIGIIGFSSIIKILWHF